MISPESVESERVEKFREYETAGVKELWLIDADARECEFYELAEERFKFVAKMKDGVFRSKTVEGFSSASNIDGRLNRRRSKH